jgi:multiple sugar transport system permease protein
MSAKRRSFTSRQFESFWGYVFILPNFIGTLIFLFIPIVYSLYISLHKWDMIRAPQFIGLRNFLKKMVEDEQFHIALANTAVFSFVSIPIGVAMALLIAWFLSANLKGTAIFRSIIFIPVILSMVAVAMVWCWLLNGDYGILNFFMGLIHINGINFLGDERYAMLSVIAISIWKSLGFNMVILIAAFKEVPEYFYEAAEIDGASSIRKFFSISLPLIYPSLFFVIIMSIINSFQVFDVIYLTTQGGPGTATQVIYYLIWQNAFRFFDMGYASALSWVVFIMIFTLTLLQMRFSKDHMENIFE